MSLMLRSWLCSLIFCAFLLTLVQAVIPDGTLKKAAGFTGGLLLLLCAAKPVFQTDWKDLKWEEAVFREEIEEQTEELEWDLRRQIEERIAEETASYISEQAVQMGIQISVSVETIEEDDGVIVPAVVRVNGPYVQALADCIERDLGIPPERQVWSE